MSNELLIKMDKLEHKVEGLKEGLDYIKDILEDSILTSEESKLFEQSLKK